MGLITGGLKVDVLVTNLTLMSYLVFLSLGQTVVITGGDGAIDLSIQYTVALAAYLASLLCVSIGLLPGLLITLLACACVGIVNGFVNLYIKVPPMITTLGCGLYCLFLRPETGSQEHRRPPMRASCGSPKRPV